MTPPPAADAISVDALIERYAREGLAELAEAEAADAAFQDRLRAAFEAGAGLAVKQAIDLYDPVDRRLLRVDAGQTLVVASHEGDILLGQLADNSHSIGVLYEEAHRWHRRKYFLPVAVLCDATKIEATGRADGAELSGRGLDERGVDAAATRAVQRIEDLLWRDERAMLPRGSLLVLGDGVGATTEDGVSATLPKGARVIVAEAVDPDADEPPVVVEHAGTRLTLPFAVVAALDWDKQVFLPAQRAQMEREALARRDALRRMVGVGLGVACAVGTGAALIGMAGVHERRRVAASVVPQLGLLAGFFQAGGAHWHTLQGIVYDLQQSGCAPAVRALAQRLQAVAQVSDAVAAGYRSSFHRTVHVGWNETKHYRTDKDGKRHYTHSTWTKVHRTMWVEPSELSGFHGTVTGWAAGDRHRVARAARLEGERIFALLDADAADAERDFRLVRHDVGFARDASLSALSAVLFSAPPTFYDDLLAATDLHRVNPGDAPRLRGVPVRKHTFLLAGAVAGIVLAERHRRAHTAELRQNRYALGAQLEAEIRRVPGLSLGQAWTEFFGGPDQAALPADVRAREAGVARIARDARSFTYVHGGGWDNGRPLDPCHVDGDFARDAARAAAGRFEATGADLVAFLDRPDAQRALHRVLRNAVGTEVLDAQMDEDEDEAKGGSVGRAWRFALPVWGAAILDAMMGW